MPGIFGATWSNYVFSYYIPWYLVYLFCHPTITQCAAHDLQHGSLITFPKYFVPGIGFRLFLPLLGLQRLSLCDQ